MLHIFIAKMSRAKASTAEMYTVKVSAMKVSLWKHALRKGALRRRPQIWRVCCLPHVRQSSKKAGEPRENTKNIGKSAVRANAIQNSKSKTTGQEPNRNPPERRERKIQKNRTVRNMHFRKSDHIKQRKHKISKNQRKGGKSGLQYPYNSKPCRRKKANKKPR